MKAALSEVKAVYSTNSAASWSLLDSCSPALPQLSCTHRTNGTSCGKGDGADLTFSCLQCLLFLLEDSHLHSESSLHQAGKWTFLPTNNLVWEGHPFHEKHAHIEHNLDNLLHPGDAGSRGDPSFSYSILSHLWNGLEPQLSMCGLRTPRIHEGKMLSLW